MPNQTRRSFSTQSMGIHKKRQISRMIKRAVPPTKQNNAQRYVLLGLVLVVTMMAALLMRASSTPDEHRRMCGTPESTPTRDNMITEYYGSHGRRGRRWDIRLLERTRRYILDGETHGKLVKEYSLVCDAVSLANQDREEAYYNAYEIISELLFLDRAAEHDATSDARILQIRKDYNSLIFKLEMSEKIIFGGVTTSSRYELFIIRGQQEQLTRETREKMRRYISGQPALWGEYNVITNFIQKRDMGRDPADRILRELRLIEEVLKGNGETESNDILQEGEEAKQKFLTLQEVQDQIQNLEAYKAESW